MFHAGTSMATPHVAGVAALLFAQGRELDGVESALLATARQPVLDVRGSYTPVFGSGIVDAEAAVAFHPDSGRSPTLTWSLEREGR